MAGDRGVPNAWARFGKLKRGGYFVACVLLAAVPVQAHSQAKKLAPAQPWYVSAAAIHRVMLKPQTQYWRFEHLSMDSATAEQQMLDWEKEGITALEIFAPEEGGW
jgi:hypothetical protein